MSPRNNTSGRGRGFRRFLLLLILLGGFAWAWQQNLLPAVVYEKAKELPFADRLPFPSDQEPEPAGDFEVIPEPEITKTKSVNTPTANWSPPVSPFAHVDEHVRKTPHSAEMDIPRLAAYLEKGAASEMEKARAIYTWMALNITYDDAGYNSGMVGKTYSAQSTFNNRSAVCEGFANLTKALADEMGLECAKIIGYAKGFGYRKGKKFRDSNHAWNAIKADGRWVLLDPTWGEGYGENIGGKLQSTKKFTDFWFDTPSYQMLFSHLPTEPKWQLIPDPISLADYEQMPGIAPGFFDLGFSGKAMLKRWRQGQLGQMPMIYRAEIREAIKMKEGPVNGIIVPGQEYTFQFDNPGKFDMAAIQGNDWSYFQESNGTSTLSIQPKRGSLKIMVRWDDDDQTYWGLMEYTVRGRPA